MQILLNEPVYLDMEPRAVVHYDASELGLLRKSVRPPKPFVPDPEPIRAACPATHRSLLEHTLGYYALEHALELARWGKFADSREFMRRYPLSRAWRWDYLRMRAWALARRLVKGIERPTASDNASAPGGRVPEVADKLQ
jgi:hypothetical protein